jgi:hypothetical protein
MLSEGTIGVDNVFVLKSGKIGVGTTYNFC